MPIDVQSLEAKLREYRETSQQIKTLEEKRKKLGQELLGTFSEGIKKYQTPHFKVYRQQRVSIKTTIEDATRFQAVKTEVVVDKDKLKALHEEGHPIPGITQTEFVMVKEIDYPL